MRLVAIHRPRDVGVKIEVDRVLAPERDEIARKGEVVADKHLETDCDLKSHRSVIRRADPHRSAALLGRLDREIEYREETCTTALDRELLAPDGNAPDQELPIDRSD